MSENVYNNGEISVDADILQSRRDVLRARDIFPNYSKQTNLNNQEAEKPQASYKIPAFNELMEMNKQSQSVELADEDEIEIEIKQDQAYPQIPKFDLAMQILENQRKSAAFKRVSPTERNNIIPPIAVSSVEQDNNPQQDDINEVDELDDIIEKQLEVEPKQEVSNVIFQKPEAKPEKTNIGYRPHIADRIKLAMSRPEETIINEIVQRDIERFLKIA
jgi:hypothetical protein